jgi:precorrin-6A/cobalt-precorrin-6A reductase
VRHDRVPMRVLVLAGTAEAAALAGRLATDGAYDVTASLAGHTRTPVPLPCPVRTGGFGGVDGLVEALRLGGFAALVDATHPFAAVMPHHAAAAADELGLPRVRLLRPPWAPGPDDRWIEVDDLAAAAGALQDLGARRVLLTTGRLELAPFAAVGGAHFVVRTIEPPEPLPLPSATVVRDRAPYTVSGEVALLREHTVDALVTKNSGGEATVAKLTAARTLGVPVVMVRRPPQPPGPLATTVDDAAAWLAGVAAAAPRPAQPGGGQPWSLGAPGDGGGGGGTGCGAQDAG